MKSVALTAYPRSLVRRLAVKKLRANGRVPATIYGRLNPPQNIEVKQRELHDLIHTAHSEILLVDLAVEGDAKGKRLALVQEVQHHPLSDQMLHIDFHEVAADEQVIVNVPVESVGEAAGVKSGGGVLEHVLFRLKVRALPKDLPEFIHVDVSALEIGQSIHIGEIATPAGCEILGHKDAPVLTVAAPVAEEVVAPVEGATPAAGDVEMIKEKKEDGEAGATPAAGKKDEKAADKAGAKGAEKAAAKPAEKKK